MYIAILAAFLGIFLIFGHLLPLTYLVFAAIFLHLFIIFWEKPEL